MQNTAVSDVFAYRFLFFCLWGQYLSNDFLCSIPGFPIFGGMHLHIMCRERGVVRLETRMAVISGV